MKVLSLFDGISCGKVALERSGVSVDAYYASEIDEAAMAISKKNHLDIVQLGDIEDIDVKKLGHFDLVIGGSPCQGFSSAGLGGGFDDPRSKLFFKFVEIVNEVKPKWFLLENVRMKKEWLDIISHHMGVEPININSKDFSAQLRNRFYWTNIPVAEYEDKGILLQDVITDECSTDRDKSYCIDANYGKGSNIKSYRKGRRQIVFHGDIFEKPFRILTVEECEALQTLPIGYTDNAGVAKTNRYKAIGNGWTVDVIAHIFKGLTPP